MSSPLRSELLLFLPSLVLLWAVLSPLEAGAQRPDRGRTAAPPAQTVRLVHPDAGPVMAWPVPVPVRLEPAGRDELFVTLLGDVRTPLADGLFDPVADRVTRNDGMVIEHYYRDRLGVRWYSPIDKSVFPLPPSGWCSWYYYYQEIDAAEVLVNADWVAEHLKPYGARYVQIDDGWQGTGHGLGENRDWSTIDVRFREPGMEGIARHIRDLGLEAGLWLAPHGQSNDGVAHSSGAFLRKPDGTSASSTWEGTWLVDPTRPEAHAYLRDLFGRLTGWGFSYFKIDGQPIVIGEYEVKQEFMAAPPPADEVRSNERLYRETLATIRSAIGDRTYLLGCWGIPLAGMGIMNGSRTAGDIVQGWDGFLVAADAVHDWNYLHNVVWYADPDVLLVRPPLSEGTARAWATIQGLSGQALMASDNMPDLPASRVELLRRVYPAADVRPLDLFPPEGSRKPVWDLKVAHLGRTWDVVGVFNWSELQPLTRLVRWADLGLDEEGVYHVWDFWGGSYLGAWEDGVFMEVPAADVRVLTLVPHRDRPVLLSTSRHLTQGWVDLRDLTGDGTATGPAERPVLSGRSRIIGSDPYTLVFGLPRSAPTYRIASVRVHAPDGVPAPGIEHTSHQGYATVTLTSPVTAEVDWEVTFEPTDLYRFPVQAPGAPQVLAEGITGALLYWPTQYHVKAGYRIELDGRPLGIAFTPTATLRDLEPGRTYRVGVRSVWYDGSASPNAGEREFTPDLPVLLHLSDLEPLSARQGWGSLQRDRSVDRNPLKIGGETAERGLGTHSTSEIRYRVFGRFRKFLARVGVDDEVRPPRPVELVFEVWGDGKRLWQSPVMRSGQAPVPVDVEIRGVQELVLKVLPGSDGIDYDHADWLEARVIR